MAAAEELAACIRTQWEAEAARRRLNDPYPLPVHWVPADGSLVDTWDLITRLATTGAGWPMPIEGCADGPDELAGKDNELAKILVRVPTGRLVVLGEPGAGKTMLMVRLVLDLLARGRRVASEPVPVLLNASSWNPDRQGFYEWLVERLIFNYPNLAAHSTKKAEGASIAETLLDQGNILPILDGLDEIPYMYRTPAIGKINDDLKPGVRLVLTCRTEDYRKAVNLSARNRKAITLRGAAGIKLKPLDPVDIADYLRKDEGEISSRSRWEPVICVLGAPSPVAKVLSNPLMASLARVVYNPRPGEYTGNLPDPTELCAFPDSTDIERHLFDAYIPAAYRGFPARVPRHRSWPKRHAGRWLAYMARNMEDARTQDFAWWQLIALAPTTATLIFSTPIAIILGVAGVFAGVRIPGTIFFFPLRLFFILWAVLMALSYMGSFRKVQAPASANSASSPTEVLTVERWKTILNRVGLPAVAGVTTWAVSGVFFGFRPGIPFGIIAALVVIFCWEYPVTWSNLQVARFWLALHRRVPWRLMTFLKDAHERGVLRQVGTVYQFRHIELQRRLASQGVKQGNSGEKQKRQTTHPDPILATARATQNTTAGTSQRVRGARNEEQLSTIGRGDVPIDPKARALEIPGHGSTPTLPAVMLSRDTDRDRFQEVHLVEVRVEVPSNSPIVLLKEAHGNRYLPIWIGAVEATAIAFAPQGMVPSRPLTHDLFRDVLKAANIQLLSARITSLVNGQFDGDLVLSNGSIVSSRPSDGIALAIRTGAPVLASREILTQAGTDRLDSLGETQVGGVDSAKMQPFGVDESHSAPDKDSRDLTIPEPSTLLMTELELVGVRVEVPSNSPIVLLKEAHGNRYLPIWIGAVEATAIAIAQQGMVPSRPLTHDLFRDVLKAVNIQLLSARITSLVNGQFDGDLVLSNGSNVKARPSDAVALAIRTGATIEVRTEILEEAGVEIPKD